MTVPLTTFKRGDVVLTPFPFTDRDVQKRRPVVILSTTRFHDEVQQVIGAMITTAEKTHWSSDVPILDVEQAGLSDPSVVRFKLFTLKSTLILKHLGTLSATDYDRVKNQLAAVLIE